MKRARYAVGVSITMVRPDGQACRNEAVVWTSKEAADLIRSTWAQFRAQAPYVEPEWVESDDDSFGRAFREGVPVEARPASEVQA